VEAFPDEMLACRPLLRAHCYRMLGHPQDADDAVQDTFVRAVRHLDGFEGRASPKTWLLRIATRVCLTALEHRGRRRMPTEVRPGSPEGPFAPTPLEEWVAPYPGTWLQPPPAPDEELARRRRVDLALVTVLQKLPPRQRAALLLAEVFDWSAPEIAETLETTVVSVRSALQRAREKLGRGVPGHVEVDPVVVQRYREAFARYDVDALVALLAEDVTFDMPPIPTWLRGREDVRAFLLGPGSECRGSVIRAVDAGGNPGFAQWRNGGRDAWALVVLETAGGAVSAIHSFLDAATLFPLFGLPERVDEETPVKSGDSRGHPL